MNLTFTNRRFIAPCKPEDVKVGAKPWLREGRFSPSDKEQLVQIMGNYFEGEITAERVFAAHCEEFGRVCRVPMEWWDVIDETGNARYQLWIYMVDSGRLFEAGTNRVVADIIQFRLESTDAELIDSLCAAYDAIPDKWRRSELVSGGFEFD